MSNHLLKPHKLLATMSSSNGSVIRYFMEKNVGFFKLSVWILTFLLLELYYSKCCWSTSINKYCLSECQHKYFQWSLVYCWFDKFLLFLNHSCFLTKELEPFQASCSIILSFLSVCFSAYSPIGRGSSTSLMRFSVIKKMRIW